MSFDSGPDRTVIGHVRHGIFGRCYRQKRADVGPKGGNTATSAPTPRTAPRQGRIECSLTRITGMTWSGRLVFCGSVAFPPIVRGRGKRRGRRGTMGQTAGLPDSPVTNGVYLGSSCFPMAISIAKKFTTPWSGEMPDMCAIDGDHFPIALGIRNSSISGPLAFLVFDRQVSSRPIANRAHFTILAPGYFPRMFAAKKAMEYSQILFTASTRRYHGRKKIPDVWPKSQ